MRRSNWNFSTPPPTWQTSGIWVFPVPRECGIWRIRPSLGCGIWTFSGCGGVNWTGGVRFLMIFFLRVPKSLTAIKMCLDDMKDFKRRDIAISQVAVFSFLENELSNEFWLRNSCLSYYRVKTIWYVFTTLFHYWSCTFLLEVINGRWTIQNIYSCKRSGFCFCMYTVPSLNNLCSVSEL